MIEIKEPFKYRFEKALAHNNIKPSELSRLSGISEATISQYRSGYSKPKDKRLVMIANILNVDPSWLMGLDVPMERTTIQESTIINRDLSPDENQLIQSYQALNETGKAKVREYASDLSEQDKYTHQKKMPRLSL